MADQSISLACRPTNTDVLLPGLPPASLILSLLPLEFRSGWDLVDFHQALIPKKPNYSKLNNNNPKKNFDQVFLSEII